MSPRNIYVSFSSTFILFLGYLSGNICVNNPKFRIIGNILILCAHALHGISDIIVDKEMLINDIRDFSMNNYIFASYILSLIGEYYDNI